MTAEGVAAQQSLLLNQFVPYLMVNLAKRISDACATSYEQDFNITVSEWRVLARLAENDSQNSSVLGQVTFMDKSKVSRAVKLLDARGFLHKEKDETDNRVTHLSLSAQGRSVYHQIAPEALAWESRLLQALDTTEYRDLLRIIQKLDGRLDELEV